MYAKSKTYVVYMAKTQKLDISAPMTGTGLVCPRAKRAQKVMWGAVSDGSPIALEAEISWGKNSKF